MVKYWFEYLIGKYRLMFGFCPLCNSDAPELDFCPVCKSYSSSRGDKFPPEKETKDRWWKGYHEIILMKRWISEIIRDKSKHDA